VIDSLSGALMPTLVAIDEFDKHHRWGTPERPDRATWGESPEAAAGMEAMMALAGKSTGNPARA
jgi:hypothetical protein